MRYLKSYKVFESDSNEWVKILPEDDKSRILGLLPQGWWDNTKISNFVVNGRKKMIDHYIKHFQKPETIEKLKGGNESEKKIISKIKDITIKIHLMIEKSPSPNSIQWVELDRENPYPSFLTINVNWWWYDDNLPVDKKEPIEKILKKELEFFSESDFFNHILHECGHCIEGMLLYYGEMEADDIKDCTYYDKSAGLPPQLLSSSERHSRYIMKGTENFARLQVIRKELGLSGNKRNDELVTAFENKVKSGAFKSPNVEITIDEGQLYFRDSEDTKLSKIKNMPNPEPNDINDWIEKRVRYGGKPLGPDMRWLLTSHSAVLPYDDEYRIAVDLSKISELNREWVKADTDKTSVAKTTA